MSGMAYHDCLYVIIHNLWQKVLKCKFKGRGSGFNLFFRPSSGVLFLLAPCGSLTVIGIDYSRVCWPTQQASTRQPPLSTALVTSLWVLLWPRADTPTTWHCLLPSSLSELIQMVSIMNIRSGHHQVFVKIILAMLNILHHSISTWTDT